MASGARAGSGIPRDEDQESAILKLGSQGLPDGGWIGILVRESGGPHVLAGEVFPRGRLHHGPLFDQPCDRARSEPGSEGLQFTVIEATRDEEYAVGGKVLEVEEIDGCRGHS